MGICQEFELLILVCWSSSFYCIGIYIELCIEVTIESGKSTCFTDRYEKGQETSGRDVVNVRNKPPESQELEQLWTDIDPNVDCGGVVDASLS